MAESRINNHAACIWSVADLLRGDYKPWEYGKVILPLTVLRRLDCVLEPTKPAVLDRAEKMRGRFDNVDPVLRNVARQAFYNISRLDFRRLLDDPGQAAGNLRAYTAGFSPGAREAIDRFDFDVQIARLARSNLLYLVLARFADIDLNPDLVSNIEMGYLYEELVRRFSELSNETAGEHFTPREVIRLMVNLLFAPDDDALTGPGAVRTLYDPACGTGGMLSVAEDHLRLLNPGARLEVFGQGLNDETYAICRSDMMLKGQDASRIARGNSFTEDGHPGRRFDYLLANPPFGVEWKKVADVVRAEHEQMGYAGRFGAGLPRINDGSFLFLQHMVAKMKPLEQGGSRLAIVFNGSPLFSGAAGSGESEIRRWLIENDMLEAVVALPDQLFYNTGISTYFWVVTNRKSPERRGTVQLVDARDCWVKMRKSLGEKRKEISAEQIAEITRRYGDFAAGERVKILPNAYFGYQRITVERPLRLRWEVSGDTVDRLAATKQWAKLSISGQAEVTAQLTALVGVSTTERAAMKAKLGPLPKGVEKQVWGLLAVPDPEAPIVTDHRANRSRTRTCATTRTSRCPLDRLSGPPIRVTAWPAPRTAARSRSTSPRRCCPTCRMPGLTTPKPSSATRSPLTRQFYRHLLPRPLAEIDAEIKQLEAEIQELLREVTE